MFFLYDIIPYFCGKSKGVRKIRLFVYAFVYNTSGVQFFFFGTNIRKSNRRGTSTSAGS